ncbi:LOW QUALITY PROTEIN: solute carrier family 2, facilitated glucose transporter member 7 [Camelus ferus]|uniref:Solute carrier family 2, facilitated glucose transporter member 5 n=1 Tax=Camelus ferus TaxID=419612 RepID=A0A8B8U7W7_CAMFR|nr:LOW QUALITY PROTEIN: solute carrier family 2, facilitated glucose transporter member 7 [Camelus ferus]
MEEALRQYLLKEAKSERDLQCEGAKKTTHDGSSQHCGEVRPQCRKPTDCGMINSAHATGSATNAQEAVAFMALVEEKEAGTPPLAPSKKGRLQPTLVLATLSAAFGSAFQYGYNIAVVNTPHKVLKSFYNETYLERHGAPMDERVTLLLWSCTVSMFPLGGLVGSLVVGLLVDKCGRKGTLLINNVFAITPAILMGVSKVAKAFEPIVFSRVLLGVCAGISYSALLCPCDWWIKSEVPFGLGNAWSGSGQPHPGKDWVPLPLVLIEGWNHVGWPVLLALTGVPALFRLLSLPFFPESPRYTLIQKKDEETARQALRKLRGWTDVEDEIEEMRVEDQAERAEGRLSVLNLFTFRPLRWQLVSIIVLMAGQQLSGVNVVNYYVDMIYLSTGVEAAHSQYVTVGAGVVNIVMTVISAGAVERLGRRRLLLVGYGICGSACLVLTLALLFQGTVPELSYLGIICVFAYIAGHSTGPSPVPSVVRTEIFLQSSRPAAFMVDGAVHWLTNFIVGFVFPSVQLSGGEVIGAYSFIIFAGICLLTAVYIYVVIPETKGRTFVEINRIFAKRNRVEIPEKKEEITDVGPCVPSLTAQETSF